jgi:cytochrome c6
MKAFLRNLVILFGLILLVHSVSFAVPPGEQVYKQKCQVCHGASGMGDSPAGKAMHVKPVNHPDVQKQTMAQMVDAVKNGQGGMRPFGSALNDEQIRESVKYFRGLK